MQPFINIMELIQKVSELTASNCIYSSYPSTSGSSEFPPLGVRFEP